MGNTFEAINRIYSASNPIVTLAQGTIPSKTENHSWGVN